MTIRQWVIASAAALLGLLPLGLDPFALAVVPQPERIVCVCGNDHPSLFLSDADGQGERPLLAGPGPNYNASFSVDGKWIVFTSDRAGSADIYRVHIDGTGLERLTNNPAFDDQGALSPDGRRLAFVSTREGGTANIWLLDLASHHYRNLTQGMGGNFRPSWSPDGQWIAFTSDRDTYPGRADPQWELLQLTAVYIVHPDGTGLRRLTPLDQFASSPKWSADGSRIVYSQAANIRGTHLNQRAPGIPQIASINVASGVQELLTDGDAWKLSPQFLAGTEIGYLNRDQDKPGIAYVPGQKIPLGRIEHPAWSPDGKMVVYQKPKFSFSWMTPVFSQNSRYQLFQSAAISIPAVSPDGRQVVYPNGNKLEIMDADGSKLRDLFDTGAREKVINYVSWSPDGQYLAFAMGRGKPGPIGQISVIRPDGSGLKLLTRGEDSSDFPSFSPDSKRLVYRIAGREQGLRIMSLDNDKITRLTDGPDDFPAWSPRSNLIVFTSFRTGDSEVYTIRPDGSDLRQLTHDHGNDGHPIWSPDGKWITFASSRAGWKDEGIFTGGQAYGEVFVMREDGTDARQLTDNQREDGPVLWLSSASTK